MLVSIVIVTRNRSSTLLKCLRSVAMQDYPAIEVIVVDNGSEDDTLQMLATQFPSAIVLPQHKNTGAPEGRNIGIQHATGDICVCMDDDAEFLDSQAVRQSVDYFIKDQELGCLCMRIIGGPDDRIIRKLIPRRDRKVITEDTPGAMFVATGCAIRRTAFYDAGEFWTELNPYFGEEPELSYRLLDKGYSILHTPHITVRHYETPLERPKGRRIYYGTRNTPWLAIRNLPWYSVIGLTTLSWGYFFLMAVIDRQVPMFFEAMWASIKHMPAVWRIRKPINKRARKLLWQHSGLIVW